MSTLDTGLPPTAAPSPHNAQGFRYPGSPPFDDSELSRLVFRGREAEANAVLHSILSFDLYVVFGASGMGKTSLLNAGVLEGLRARELWPFVVRLNDPDARPIDLVTSSLFAGAQADDAVDVTWHPAADASSAHTLWDLFSALEVWRGNVLQRPVPIFDQFEELFTLGFPDGARQDFIVQLGELVRHHRVPNQAVLDVDARVLPTPDAKVVVVLREDSLGELDAMSTHVPQIMRHRFRVQGLEPDQAKAAIVDPAEASDPRLRSQRFTYSDGAAELLLDFLRTRDVRGRTDRAPRVDPSQLQIICQHIERSILPRKTGGSSDSIEITPEDLGGENGLNDVLRDFYQREVAALDPEDRSKARALCEAGLISRTGRRLSLEEGEIEADWGVSQPLLDELIDRRLLRAEPRVGSIYYELAHDTLVPGIVEQAREWTTLEQARTKVVNLHRWALGLSLPNLFFGWLLGPLMAIAIIGLRSPLRERTGRWRSKVALGLGLLWPVYWATSGLWGALTPEPYDGLYDSQTFTARWLIFGVLSAQPAIGTAVGLAWPVTDERTSPRWRWALAAAAAVPLVVAGISVFFSAAVPTGGDLKPGSWDTGMIPSTAAPIIVGDGPIQGGTVELEIPEYAGVTQDLQVTQQRSIVIDVIGDAGFDPVLFVLEGDLQLASDDDGRGNRDARLELDLAPGEYTLEVFGLTDEPGRVTIEVATPEDARTAQAAPFANAADPNEPNDTAIDATPIGTEANGTIESGGDHDWFALDHAGGELTIFTSGCEDGDADTFLTLWEADGVNYVARNNDASDDDQCSTIDLDDLEAGEYYLTVESFRTSVPVPSYTLTVSSE